MPKTPTPSITLVASEVDELLAVLWQTADVIAQAGTDSDLVARITAAIDKLMATRNKAELTVERHAETWLEEKQLGSCFPSYKATFPLPATFIDDDHASLAETKVNGAIIDLGIPGWLRPGDALKLYEMAYFSAADILEIGSYHGLSTSIMAKAVRASGKRRTILSLELDPGCVAEAKRHTAPWSDLVTFIVADARIATRDLIDRGITFGFAFVDHSHTYDMVYAACADLKSLLTPRAFALFHDFNDERNGSNPDYGVWQAVRDSFSDGSFEFYGIYGCTGLWRKALMPARGE